MTLVKMHDEAFNPIYIGLFGANAVMLDANLGADLVEELGLSGRRGHGNLRWMKNVQPINAKCSSTTTQKLYITLLYYIPSIRMVTLR